MLLASSLTEEYTEEAPAYTVQKISYEIIYRKGVNTNLIKFWSLHLFPFTDMSQLLLHDTISQGDQVGYLILIISFKHTCMFAVLFTLRLFVSQYMHRNKPDKQYKQLDVSKLNRYYNITLQGPQ